jgi:hypothetical protein
MPSMRGQNRKPRRSTAARQPPQASPATKFAWFRARLCEP